MKARLLGSLTVGAIVAAVVVIYDGQGKSCCAGGVGGSRDHTTVDVQSGVRVRRRSRWS